MLTPRTDAIKRGSFGFASIQINHNGLVLPISSHRQQQPEHLTDQLQPVAFNTGGGVGMQLGFQRQLFSMGQNLGGGIMVTSGIEHDGQRLYSWGELAFTLTPQFKEKGKS